MAVCSCSGVDVWIWSCLMTTFCTKSYTMQLHLHQLHLISFQYVLSLPPILKLLWCIACMWPHFNMYLPFPSPLDLIMVVQVVSSFSSYPVRSPTPTMACLSTLPMIPTQFRSAQPLRSYTTTWSGLDLLGGSLVWSLLKASYWMCSSQGLSTSHYSASEFVMIMHPLLLAMHAVAFV